jgi:hypothetical protein
MFAIIACVLFAIAGVLEGSGAHTNTAWLAPLTLVCFGLACLALHCSGRAPL